MKYTYFSLDGLRHRAWVRAGTLYVEAITRLGIRLVSDDAAREAARRAIEADAAWEGEENARA